MEGWHSYDKTDAATHPPKAGGYLVTLKGPTGHLSVEVRPFESGKGFAGDWSRYSVQAWRSIPKPFGDQFLGNSMRRPLSADVFGEAA